MNLAKDNSLHERIEQLNPRNAVKNMNLIGRMLLDGREMSLWEHDTATLPGSVRRLRRRARSFAQKHIRPLAPYADLHPHDYDPKPLLKAAAKEGFLNTLLPMPFGGVSFLPYFKSIGFQIAIIAEEFATECGGLGLLLMSHSLGVGPFALSGSVHTYLRHLLPLYIKTRYLGKPECMAFCITEPGAGSDVEESEGGAMAKLVTTAKYDPELKGYILNGQKCFISNGAIADKVTVFARIENEGIESWTCFLVEKGMKGFSVGRSERKMGQRASDASELIFEDVFIPKKNVRKTTQSGWANNRNVLNYSRPSVGAMALGHGRGAFERCLEFCKNTNLGRKKLIEYQEVQYELADMAMSLWSARSMIWQSCQELRCYQSVSASAKVIASDTAFKVCNQAMELMGDHGYVHSNGVERAMRDSRLTQIYEGTNQINRLALFEHQQSSDFKL